VRHCRGHHLPGTNPKYRWPQPTREHAHFILTAEDDTDILTHSIDSLCHGGPTLDHGAQQWLYAIAGFCF
jgi:hypothetical protein